MALYILAGVLILLLVLMNLSAHITAEYRLEPQINILTVKIRFLFFKFTVLDTTVKKPKEEKEKKREDSKKEKISFKRIESVFNTLVDSLNYLKKRLHIELFEIKVREGMGDAAETGIAVGAGYALFSLMVSTLDNLFDLKRHFESVTPDFENVCFYINFKTHIRIKFIHSIRLIIKLSNIVKG